MAHSCDADIIIVGGGLVGLTCALALAKCGFSVHVIETHLFEPLITAGEYQTRVSAITPASVKILQALDVWPAIQALRVSPFQQIEVWEAAGDAQVNFNGHSLAQPVLGYIVENAVMQTALFHQLKKYRAIVYDAPAKVISLQQTGQVIEVVLDDDKSLQAKLLIGADGALSQVRKLAGISVTQKNYVQHALVATIKTEQPHHKTARQRFLADGPLAFLPLDDPHHCSIVWSHTSDMAKCLAQMPQAEFNSALQTAFDNKLGKLQVVSPRVIFPLSRQHAERYVQARIALIGDAAHVLHPLAGQGVNLGLLDAITLADILYTALQQRRDIGLLHTLRRYEQQRRHANQQMLTVVDAFHHLFSPQRPSLSLLRQWGLQFTERCQPVKNFIMQRAMGLSVTLPQWIEQTS